ncbi:EF-hand calcium-binding domain-containing protein 3-like [Ptychodera flava]|uniref:EF-hand calcium-binding domain-containing protein 3-like n=1 Tax=Ptychodera flava TaxID=63121 RepID=UPI00396A7FBF
MSGNKIDQDRRGGILVPDLCPETHSSSTIQEESKSTISPLPQVSFQRPNTVAGENDAKNVSDRARTRRTSLKVNKLSGLRRQSNARRASLRKTSVSYGPEMIGIAVKKKAPAQKKEKHGLTKGQVEAFREVFDLFDSNGGGSIDAEELEMALRSVDIHLSRDEIEDVMNNLDNDGNGEIDFEEFLTLMTNTERFLESFVESHEGPPKDNTQGIARETLLFDALTQFMKKSALQAMDEIVGYYKTKYKKAQIPHVVGHYAAGARLIGLTEKQLVMHLEHLKRSNAGQNEKSPYAQPLHIFITPEKPRPVPRRCNRGRITLRVNFRHNNDRSGLGGNPYSNPHHSANRSKNSRDPRSKNAPNAQTRVRYTPRLGATHQRLKVAEFHLPTLHKKNEVLTYDDLPKIRKSVDKATKEYYKHMTSMKRNEAIKLWRSLYPSQIPSTLLLDHFKKVFCAYSSAEHYTHLCKPCDLLVNGH